MDKPFDPVQRILDLDTLYQRELYAGWPQSWIEMKWPSRAATRALLMIESGYAQMPAEIADLLKVSRTSVTGMLDRLENDNLITRRINPKDRRCFILELTDAGRELVRQIDELRLSQIKEAVVLLSIEEQEQLMAGLEALVRGLKTVRSQANVPLAQEN